MSITPLSARRLAPEAMDHPQLDPTQHVRALRGLERLNLVSRVAAGFWREIQARLRPPRGASFRLLDIASGGGDVPICLWRLARRGGVRLKILGLDKSATACQYATAQVKVAANEITFQQHDLLEQPLPGGFDIVTCSLFLHQLKEADVAALLRQMSAVAPLLLVSDLRRNLRGYALAQAACRLLTASAVVHADGPQSVVNAFSIAEMRQLCNDAGLPTAEIERTWPCRMLIVHDRRTKRV